MLAPSSYVGGGRAQVSSQCGRASRGRRAGETIPTLLLLLSSCTLTTPQVRRHQPDGRFMACVYGADGELDEEWLEYYGEESQGVEWRLVARLGCASPPDAAATAAAATAAAATADAATADAATAACARRQAHVSRGRDLPHAHLPLGPRRGLLHPLPHISL